MKKHLNKWVPEGVETMKTKIFPNGGESPVEFPGRIATSHHLQGTKHFSTSEQIKNSPHQEDVAKVF